MAMDPTTAASGVPAAAPMAIGGQVAQRQAEAPMIGNTQRQNPTSDADYLKLFNDFKRESFADWWIFERQWTKIIHYLNNRMWLAPYDRSNGWRDARMPRNIPKPVTNKATEADQAIRAMFTSIKFGVIVRPVNQTNDAISTATVAGDMAPLLHDLHDMDAVMNEGDYWLVNTGNVLLHSAWDWDSGQGKVEVPWETCTDCGLAQRSDTIANNRQKCARPDCQGTTFTPALNPDQSPRVDKLDQGCGVTTPLSLLEVRFPLNRVRWRDVPGLIRMRWRDKAYYESHPKLREYAKTLKFQRGSSERSLQIFQSLPYMNDLPSTRGGGGSGQSAASEGEGIAEYEMWMRPTPAHPEGLVIRVAGDDNPTVLHLEDEEALPGVLPYHDVKGNPLFTFSHAGYKHVGGRVVASGAHDPVMTKYDALNRLDSFIEMITMRMAAPQWMIPKGVEIQWLGDSPGLPGLILNWNAQQAGTAGRPERVAGIPPDAALMKLREMLEADIEAGLGTFDILRGAKPAGVEAFSALQLLVERGQARFANSFMARGKMYRDWFGFSLELEREFGPTSRTLALLTPTRSYTFKTFQKADLRGDVVIVIEDGTYTPKTSLGERAAIEHLKQLGFINTQDPDQQYAIFRKFGMSALIPSIDAHVQAALKKQEDFEAWMRAGEYKNIQPGQEATILTSATYPLKWRPWYDPIIHRQEFLKWANSDSIQQLLTANPAIEGLLGAHITEIDLAIMQKQAGMIDPAGTSEQPGAAGGSPTPPSGQQRPQGAALALRNSNQNSGSVNGQPQRPAIDWPGANAGPM